MSKDKCDKYIWEHGASAGTLNFYLNKVEAEDFVEQVAKESGQRVDWHYVGGRVDILYVGDGEKVKQAIDKLTLEHPKYMQMHTHTLGATRKEDDHPHTITTTGTFTNNRVSQSCAAARQPTKKKVNL